MNQLTKLLSNIGQAFKGLTLNVSRSSLMLLMRTKFDYGREVDPRKSSIVVACVDWMCRTFPEAPIQLLLPKSDGTTEVIVDHPMLKLLEKPNDYYSGQLMLMAVMADRAYSGNGYLRIIRGAYRKPQQLWWIPSFLLTPKRLNDADFISYYEYTPGGTPEPIAKEDIIHLRYELDPDNPMLGRTPLLPLFREIFADEEAANFTAALLKNLGVPGVVISPSGEGSISPEDGKLIKADWSSKTTGDHRGEPIVIPGAIKVEKLSFNPQELDLKALRRIPEERVSAVLGIPAIVAGLGAGLDRSTFANMAEAREMAYESNIIPTQRVVAAELQTQLLPQLDSRPLRVAFDLSKVRVLQEDENKRWARYGDAYQKSLIMRSEAKSALGLQVAPEDEVYLMPMSMELVGPGAPELESVVTPPALPEPVTTDTEPIKAIQLKAFSEGQKDALGVLFIKRLDKREQKFMALMMDYFAKQCTALTAWLEDSKSLKVAQPEDEFWREWQEKLAKQARKPVVFYLTQAAKEAIEDYNLGINFDLSNPEVQKWIGDRLTYMSKEVTAATKTDIIKQLREAEAAGESIADMVERIKSYYDGIEYRAERTARTEVVEASNRGAVATYQQAGLDEWEWWASLDERQCEICGELHSKRYKIDQQFDAPHPN